METPTNFREQGTIYTEEMCFDILKDIYQSVAQLYHTTINSPQTPAQHAPTFDSLDQLRQQIKNGLLNIKQIFTIFKETTPTLAELKKIYQEELVPKEIGEYLKDLQKKRRQQLTQINKMNKEEVDEALIENVLGNFEMRLKGYFQQLQADQDQKDSYIRHLQQINQNTIDNLKQIDKGIAQQIEASDMVTKEMEKLKQTLISHMSTTEPTQLSETNNKLKDIVITPSTIIDTKTNHFKMPEAAIDFHPSHKTNEIIQKNLKTTQTATSKLELMSDSKHILSSQMEKNEKNIREFNYQIINNIKNIMTDQFSYSSLQNEKFNVEVLSKIFLRIWRASKKLFQEVDEPEFMKRKSLTQTIKLTKKDFDGASDKVKEEKIAEMRQIINRSKQFTRIEVKCHCVFSRAYKLCSYFHNEVKEFYMIIIQQNTKNNGNYNKEKRRDYQHFKIVLTRSPTKADRKSYEFINPIKSQQSINQLQRNYQRGQIKTRGNGRVNPHSKNI